MHIAYFDSGEEEAQALREAFPDAVITVVPEPLDITTVAHAAEADVVSVFVDSDVTEEVLAQLLKLRLIAARSAGVDHIALDACRERGITVVHVPRYGEATVAEHAFALILSLSRKILQSYERTERMNFDRTGLQGFDLSGKTLGVVGVGNIGQRCIRIGNGFSMKVIAFDVTQDAELAGELGFTYTDTLEDLLRRSDVVSLHVPYVPETHHLINRENITQMKPGALLINTARGALVDTKALLWALEEGIIGGAGIDVLEEEHDAYDRVDFLSRAGNSSEQLETLLRNHLLVARDDVIITPHNAFNSQEAVEKIFMTTVTNIRAYADGVSQNAVS